MRRRSALGFFCCLVLVLSSPVLAQAKYFTDGERVFSLSGILQRDGEGRTLGTAFEGFLSSGVSIGLGYSSYPLHDMDGGEGRISTLALGFTGYLSRQRAGEPLTIAVGLSASTRIGDITGTERRDTDGDVIVGVGLELSRKLHFSSSLHFAPSLSGVYSLLLHETEGGVTSQVVSFGLGLGTDFASSVVLFVEPSLLVAFSQDERDVLFGLTFGFASAP